jgi:hypothetical protein
MRLLFPDEEGWRIGRILLELIFFVGFAAVYVSQIFEMVAVLVPQIVRRDRSKEGEGNES